MTLPKSPAERVRDMVLGDHRRLRVLLNTLARETSALQKGEPDAAQQVCEVLGDLCDTLQLHLDYEDRELVPILRDANAWGQVVASRVREEHRVQRTVISALADDPADRCSKRTDAFIEELGAFIRWLEQDMQMEEATLLTDSALGEGYVVIDQNAG
jgi:hemerythrin-like domain-containing protein